MPIDPQPSGSRLPTLVQCCQRVAASHVESISSLGDGLRFELLKPVLFGCTAETLLRLETASPYLEPDTADLWKDMCFKTYPLSADRYNSGQLEEPESWREQFNLLKEEEARKFIELGSRLRDRRQEAEERKRSQAIQITDQPPPTKRFRGWATGPTSKSLFQKTRSEASRVQKTMYTRLAPSMPRGKDYRSSGPSTKLLPPAPPSASGSGITVKTVEYRRPASSSSSATISSASSVARSVPSSATTSPGSSSTVIRAPPRSTNSAPTTSHATHLAPAMSKPSPNKKDKTANLFMPKHRAYSQRAAQSTSIPSK
ncbi:hypothetical protein FIBSPDRAFT_1044358 [Athelia psychrophila]|uniref:Elongin-A n=1 Tax=Athelia psychrophila TaxID=1759441 RepID=A0A166JTG1_9AGAM|nr:hypothetical protein FIBSPDRAFT_1044358 [Fibularhizoctonia sp. CBS 109695]